MLWIVSLLLLGSTQIRALPYDPDQVDYNLNQNRTATNPLDYWGKWDNHTYTPSPANWRFPVYTLFLDKFVNGDPTNDNANGTVFEQDVMNNQLRHGGDIRGLIESLDYLHGMGIRGIYIAGTPHINRPWGADAYSPLDLTLLDHHFGTIEDWRAAMTEVHQRGMYVILDNTMATMGDLIGFQGYSKASAPFALREHRVEWKSDRRYHDFDVGDSYNDSCVYPRFWDDSGFPVSQDVTSQMQGCFNSDFDQYGDTDSQGKYPSWQRQLSKYGSVQDHLREWQPSVRAKIQHFACLTIAMLDIDGYRMDKAGHMTVDAQAEWSEHIRQCARRLGKENFFIAGEITGGNAFGSIYLGRGRQPDTLPASIKDAVSMSNTTDDKFFIRRPGKSALDATAFHYTIHRSLSRFLGLDGDLASADDSPLNWVDAWNTILRTNDLVNVNTGVFDPRHMYGTTNQDNFRWPAIRNGTHKMLLGLYITTLLMPGIPTLLWGEEQAFYVLDNTAPNYLFGRQAMSSSPAWQVHGCYSVGAANFFDFPIDSAAKGCNDDWNTLDHRDPTSAVRNILKTMYQMRQRYLSLNDGYSLRQLSNKTRNVYLPGSKGVATETGMWSTVRSQFEGVQDFTSQEADNQPVWLVYQNENTTISYKFDCSMSATALISPFDADETVRNLFPPFEEYTLQASPVQMGSENSTGFNGCLSELELPPWGFKALVPKARWTGPGPMLTSFKPGHDARVSTAPAGEEPRLAIELHYSALMDCESVTKSIEIISTTEDNSNAKLDPDSVKCSPVRGADPVRFVGGIPTVMIYKAELVNVLDGIHSVKVRNATADNGTAYTDTVDRLLFRIGRPDNPLVFPSTANYTRGLLHRHTGNKTLWISHKAAGADKFRYSLNWGSSFSDWEDYRGGNSTLAPLNWTGTKRQRWADDHVIVQYWSRQAGSSSHIQHADVDHDQHPARRFPHLFAHGKFNQFGYDAGFANQLRLDGADGRWKLHLMTEWPTATFQLSMWGMSANGKPDRSFVFGDVDGDSVLDRLPPDSLAQTRINISAAPPSPHLAWQFALDDGNYRYDLIPVGSWRAQLALYLLLATVPLITGILGIWLFKRSFYAVKFNEVGAAGKKSTVRPALLILHNAIRAKARDIGTSNSILPRALWSRMGMSLARGGDGVASATHVPPHIVLMSPAQPDVELGAATVEVARRRTVLIATMEYNIEDWAVEIKIGGLGVMAKLMGNSLSHQDLIWVVPCVGGVHYPQHRPAEPMLVTVLGTKYEVKVQYHRLRNITYVLLDAPVFRQQTKAAPYPPRMDDLESAIFYSTWNQCIALAINRFPVDIYHINDYHGSVAPLYLLPRTVPVCLSLHNAEFQGSWPLRKPDEQEEVAKVFNLRPEVVEKYVQFGNCFNLLHAGSSYLRIHQRGFGAVGVSKKYGQRSYARYPIFWGLKGVQSLPNPDPTDTAECNDTDDKTEGVKVDAGAEIKRAEFKRQAQAWAGLDANPQAELLVFVGRWSVQKGVDLIADCLPAILEENANVQLICAGPVIDLYGRFASAKLAVMMNKYPGRVYSNPEFTRLPPYIFSGADFALIPSRDEPFGLVAVEFGRKGALGIGARVGGLGQMPGWWYTVESTSPSHLRQQLKMACKEALASGPALRATMRARSAKQRFPVAQWVQDLETLQSTAITTHREEAVQNGRRIVNAGAWLSPEGHSPRHSEPPPPVPPRPQGLGILLSPTTTVSGDGADRPLPTVPYEESFWVPPAAALGEPDFAMQLDRVQLGRCELGLDAVVGSRKDFTLQKVDPFFTDSTGCYLEAFEKNLQSLNAKTSEKQLSIEEYLVKSEREWFNRYRDAKLGKSEPSSRNASPGPSSRSTSPSSFRSFDAEGKPSPGWSEQGAEDQFMLGDDYKPPTGLRYWLSVRLFDWPVYSLFLAFGQIISANSYQVTLLEGSVGQSDAKLYSVASVYLLSSICWWALYRRLPSVYVLSIPFLFYGLAFVFVGAAAVAADGSRGALQKLGTGLYAIASSSGSLFFALNFGDEGGAPMKSWIFRACSIQGTQQLYNVALWYWGAHLTRSNDASLPAQLNPASSWVTTAITIPIAALLWGVGLVLYIGLPTYYRESPGKIPTFYGSLLRRRIVVWSLVAVLLQNYFLSGPYGRNWQYLWSSTHMAASQTMLLVLIFFVGVWAGLLWGFAVLSETHSWVVPIFAVGLGAPRWCQMLWGTSNIGLYVPWAGGPVASALVGRSLWLWLGVLDSVQSVGFGMMLLQTLTRMHISCTLIAAQVLGSLATMLARASAPNRVGPGDVFPDFSAGVGRGLAKPWFWFALLAQLLVCAGFFKFFRKEQLSKP
ncbi:MAG: Cell wall alpha-1,3-glucan synthase ags1 [Thelocarpon impressellum]|nr:MAG: Cell wall alpha-1,3-glucan synthase ags1 [Thelocarpon impressellum]